MPRPILGVQQSGPKTTVQASGVQTTAGSGALTGARLQLRLRQQRSKSYIESMKRLDAGTHEQNREGLHALLEAMNAEFPELTIEQRPIGVVSRCYLGAPYVVHICDLSGNIVEHFESYRSMPAPFERARLLALHAAYALIEVYPDTLRAISADGSVSVIEK